jgi:hypothetical protein
MKLGRSFAISVTLLAFAFLAFAASPPPITSSFYGSVAANSRPVPDGTTVSAWINTTKLAARAPGPRKSMLSSGLREPLHKRSSSWMASRVCFDGQSYSLVQSEV